MILLIDNYDSFTYNVAQYAWQLGADLIIERNDQIDLDFIKQLQNQNLRGIILSPGPGRPEDAGIMIPVIQTFAAKIPILGICLGHQAIGYAFGGRVIHAPQIFHGKVSQIYHQQDALFQGMSEPFTATRYHSLVIAPDSLAGTPLQITARTKDQIIMAVKHKDYPTWGVQFHPESILTENGINIIQNFIHFINEAEIDPGRSNH